MKNKDIEVEAIINDDTTEPTIDSNIPVVVPKDKERATNDEKLRRTKVTLNLLSEGLPKQEVVEELRRMYSLSERQAYRYIDMGYDILRQSFTDEIAVNKSQSISWLYQLRNKAYDDEDYSVALKAQENIDKITGVSSTSKIELSGKDGKDLPVTINIVSVNP